MEEQEYNTFLKLINRWFDSFYHDFMVKTMLMREVKLCSGKIHTLSDDKSDKIVGTMYSLYLVFNDIRYTLIPLVFKGEPPPSKGNKLSLISVFQRAI